MVLALRALPSSTQFLSRRNCQHAKQKAAAPAPPCARPCPPSRLPRHYYFPVGHGIRASCTAWFLLCFIFQTLSVFEKSAGSGFSRQPRRGLAQGCVKQKWRYFLRCAFLLRLKARAGLPWPARSAGGRSTGPSSNSASSLYRDGQEALVPRSAGMRESGHRRVMKNEFFITLLSGRTHYLLNRCSQVLNRALQ